LEFCNGGDQKKTRVIANKSDDVCIHLNTRQQRDRQLDRHKWYNNIALCILMHADARGKNDYDQTSCDFLPCETLTRKVNEKKRSNITNGMRVKAASD